MTKRRRRNYTDEFKGEAVKLVTDQGYSVAEAARNLGVNANLLGRWKKEADQSENETASSGSMTTMQAEIKHLKKENKQLKMDGAYGPPLRIPPAVLWQASLSLIRNT